MQDKVSDPRLRLTQAKAYLIGGTPRTGKSSIAIRFLDKHGMFSVSTDAIRAMQRNLVSRSEYPALFEGETSFSEDTMRKLCADGKATDILNAQNAESEVVWQSVKVFIEGTVAEGFDVLVEGVAILPRLISELNCNYSAVFIGNRSLERPAMEKSARGDHLDWMHNFSAETFEQFPKFTSLYSEYIYSEALKHDVPYFEIGEKSFEHDLLETVTALTKTVQVYK